MNPDLKANLPFPIQTPLLQEKHCWLKPERSQHSGSVKYRLVHSKVQDANQKGLLKRDTILTEVTAGSTGIALAFAAKQLGLAAELHSYQNASPKKCRAMEALGATVVLHPVTTPFFEILDEVREKHRQGSHWHLDQFDRDTITTAYFPLAEEILAQIQKQGSKTPKYFISSVGTGGVIQGVGKVLRKHFPQIQIFSVEPDRGVHIDGIRNTAEMYMGAKDSYDRTFPDQRFVVPKPTSRLNFAQYELGESAAAVYRLVLEKGWEDVLMIAPD